jgi:hypothetical protein
VFGGRDKHAAAHQAGGIADFGNVASDGFDIEIVEVHAAKDYARTRSRRDDAHFHRRSAMQPNAAETYCIANCLLVNQGKTRKVLRKNSIPRKKKI